MGPLFGNSHTGNTYVVTSSILKIILSELDYNLLEINRFLVL
jgi:hypothetical protein